MRKLLLALTLLGAAADASLAQRPFPSSAARILVFNDQLATWSMSEAQYAVAASHYVGTQKVRRSEARHLRLYAPDFLVLHYRLGQALGHSYPTAGCAPSTDYLQIVDGDAWVQEWPGDADVAESWFFHWSGERVFSCSNGHFLADLDDPAWRAWWSAEVIRQLQDNEDDALFADSYSVPNYFGACDWDPCLPGVDAAFESAWAASEHAFTDYIQTQLGAVGLRWIPNLGALITSRDPSDWSNVDGAMVEGFAEWGGGNYFAVADWELQMDRVLPLAAGRILIAQTYPDPADVEERMFVLGSFLLIRGDRTYVNLDLGLEPEWFPEYGIYLGRAAAPLPATIADLYDAARGVYVRDFANGRVFVNPSAAARSFELGGSFARALPSGGGFVPASGIPAGALGHAPVTALDLGPHAAAVVVFDPGLLFADDFEAGDFFSWSASAGLN